MEGIPLVNIVAAIHLFFIAAFLGTVMTENLMELSVFSRRRKGIDVLGILAWISQDTRFYLLTDRTNIATKCSYGCI